jgi:hypothetical protein
MNLVWVSYTYTYKVLLGKPEEDIAFGPPGHKWEDNIKTDLKETE